MLLKLPHGKTLGFGITNLLSVFHYHVDFIDRLLPNSHIKDFDNVVVLQRAQDGYFSERCDRNAIVMLAGGDPDLLQGDHLGR